MKKKIKKNIKRDESNKKNINTSSNVRKKTFMWIMLFPPYGLYLSIKNKAVHWIISVLVLILFLLIGLISYDMVANPNRVENTLAKKVIEEFNNNDLGTVRIVDRKDTVAIEDRNFHKYKVYTNKGSYYFFLGSIDGKEYVVESVYEVEPERKLVYVSDRSNDIFTDIYPEIKEFLSKNQEKYGKDIELVNTLDDLTQEIKTENGKYRISVKFEQVIMAVRIEGEELITEYKEEATIDILPGIKKVQRNIEKITGNIIKVFDYEDIYNKRVQYVETEKGLFKIDLYDDGSFQIFENNNNKNKINN